MAGFKTHISFSTAMGIGYGAAAHFGFDVPLPTCCLATGLCSVSGMLPDIDSDSGVPVRESLAFAAAVIPMMLAQRLSHLGLPNETIILAGAGMYLLIRFVVASLLKRYTVHRGMFHSIPAAAIFAELAFLLASGEDVRLRWFQAGGVALGYLSHLLLDEIWSIKLSWRGVGAKESLGTALKLYSGSGWSNLSTYLKLGLLTFLVIREPDFMQTMPAGQFQDPTLQAIYQRLNPGEGPATTAQTPIDPRVEASLRNPIYRSASQPANSSLR